MVQFCIYSTMKKIESLSSVSFGVNYSPVEAGNVRIVQAKSIDDSGVYKPEYDSFAPQDKLSEKDFLTEGDLLFPAKGSNHFTYVVKREDLPAVASSVFFIIRVNPEKILPEFLAWCLRTPRTRHRIDVISEGSTISSIPIKEFRKLKVPVPKLEVQKKVIELQVLQIGYKMYVEKLTEKIELLNNEISKQLIGEKE